jgi:hypothetical protein
MIKKINEVLKVNDIALVVKKEGTGGVLDDNFSVDFMCKGVEYTLELLINPKNEEEVEYMGVYITYGSGYLATFIV